MENMNSLWKDFNLNFHGKTVPIELSQLSKKNFMNCVKYLEEERPPFKNGLAIARIIFNGWGGACNRGTRACSILDD